MKTIRWFTMLVIAVGGCGGMSGDAATHADSIARASQTHFEKARAQPDLPSLRSLELDYKTTAMGMMDEMQGDHMAMCAKDECKAHMSSMGACEMGMRAEIDRHAKAIAEAPSLDAAMQEEGKHSSMMGTQMGCMKCPMMESGMMGGGMMGGSGGMGM